MSGYRLVVHFDPEGQAHTLSVNLSHRAEALLVAQLYDAPAELWGGDTKICSISHTGSKGVWVISG